MGVARERVVMVGDSPQTDIEGARRAGIAGVLVAKDGEHPTDSGVVGAGASAIVADLGGLFDHHEGFPANHGHR